MALTCSAFRRDRPRERERISELSLVLLKNCRTYVRNGTPGLVPVILETHSGGAGTLCMVHAEVLISNNDFINLAVRAKLPIPVSERVH